jgi:methionine biosynthesis protein MetW
VTGNASPQVLRSRAYENPRPEVQARVPRNAHRILDLGCSSGALGAALKARQSAEVTGVEIDADYANAARDRLDRVIQADLEDLFAPGNGAADLGEFDCVVAADVLEHLRDPWGVLTRAVGHLGPGGTAVVSLPNIRYWHTFWMLGRHGTWPRTDFGICDRTHLRFFTLKDAYELLDQAGLRRIEVNRQYRLRPDRDPLSAPGPLALPGLRAFFAFQYVIAAVRD